MPTNTSDLVSLGEIDQELRRVRSLQEEHRGALARLEQEESRLLGIEKALREFLEYRRSRSAEPEVVAKDTEGRTVVFQVKQADPRGIVERAAAALKQHGSPMETWPLINKMQEAGFTSAAENIYLSVYGTINRATKRAKGPLVRYGKLWALSEWYPDGVPEAPGTGFSVLELDDTEKEEQPMLISDTVP